MLLLLLHLRSGRCHASHGALLNHACGVDYDLALFIHVAAVVLHFVTWYASGDYGCLSYRGCGTKLMAALLNAGVSGACVHGCEVLTDRRLVGD